MPRVEQVLPLSRYGKRLGTRLEGRKAQEEILAALSALPPGGVLVLDLSGVEVLSGSFADEAVAAVLSRLREGEHPDRYLYLRAPALELLEDLEAKLLARKLAALVRLGGEEGWRVLGWLPPYLGDVLACALRRGEARSVEVAQELGISPKQAALALQRLAGLRLLRRERERKPGGGYRHRYLPLG